MLTSQIPLYLLWKRGSTLSRKHTGKLRTNRKQIYFGDNYEVNIRYIYVNSIHTCLIFVCNYNFISFCTHSFRLPYIDRARLHTHTAQVDSGVCLVGVIVCTQNVTGANFYDDDGK